MVAELVKLQAQVAVDLQAAEEEPPKAAVLKALSMTVVHLVLT